MKALIDSDIFQYEFGSATDSEYRPIPWPFVQARVQGRIDHIVEATGADEYQLYITSDDKSNFRYQLATIRPYKGNRKQEKPHWYNHIRNFLVDQRGAIEVFGMEADDAISIAQWGDLIKPVKLLDGSEYAKKDMIQGYGKEYDYLETIICSRDKDLKMVPGWHYEWGISGRPDKGPYFITELEGQANFYFQLLSGDTVDNIPGLFGVGSSSNLLRRVHDCDDSYSMYTIVQEQYEKRFGSYWKQFLTENARLLHMLRTEDDVWEIPENA